jgi:hypothetical protein
VSPVGMKDKYTNVSAAALGGALTTRCREPSRCRGPFGKTGFHVQFK